MTSFKQAFALSNDEVNNATPPGTTTLVGMFAPTPHHRSTNDSEHLEWAASQQNHDEIRLVPQPSSDPADPLNLPWWRKLAMLLCMSVHPFVVNFTSSSISSALPIYAGSPIFGLPPKPFSSLSYLIAVNILMMGFSNLWWVPLANTFGRRSVTLVSLLLLILSSMWAGLTTNFNSLLAARLIMGIASGPADAVSPDVVGEIFFVHQRGRAMAIYTVFLTVGSLVGGIAGGYIVAGMGLVWIHWINVILSAITFVLCLVFQAETLYDRPQWLNDLEGEDGKGHTEHKEAVSTVQPPPSSYPPYTYLRSLKLITYRPGIGQKFLAPYKTMRLPGVWLISAWYAGLVGLIVTISVVGPQLVAAPPYLWGQDVGLINVGGVVGGLLGCIYTYMVADWTTKRNAAKNTHGFAEPEARLATALPALFIATAGSLIFGLGWVWWRLG
ncbi:hypothetical protein OPT61_g9691 [Boeremia exigua]|uniref:Uncharacterized protein n=1 Tax=Boeremia exigua TaxID=749465 RepID=A0ACC2HSZ6_9PLEO|nr:hypothetical protein OPT61_g9691 [Boeremia exigua]